MKQVEIFSLPRRAEMLLHIFRLSVWKLISSKKVSQLYFFS